MNLPCFCPNCRTLFAVDNLVVGNGTVTMTNCSTNCRYCGSEAMIIDGTYTMYDDIMHTITGGVIDREQTQQLADIASKAINNQISPSQAQKAADAVSPKFGKIMKTYNEADLTGKLTLVFLAVFILVVAPLSFLIAKPTIDRAGIILADHLLPLEETSK